MSKINITKLFLLMFILVLVMSIVSGCSNKQDTNENTSDGIQPIENYIAPDFELKDIHGNNVKLSDFRDQTVLINFWSLGCPYCLQELPYLETIAAENSSIKVLAINIDKEKDQEKLPIYIKNRGYSFTVLKDDKAETARKYMLRGIPSTFIINSEGKITNRFDGVVPKEVLDNVLTQTNMTNVPS